jgi:ABC-type antimicrobial peptide transport system permease subunit
MERRHEIGVLKAVGWRSLSVARLFVLEGLLVGLAGGLVGALLGCGAGLHLYKALSPTWAAMAAAGMGVAGLVGALAALYPARLAARVPPAEALRYE